MWDRPAAENLQLPNWQPRFWDADSGTITLGGVDVKTVEPETLFKNYAIVFQDVMLFD